MFINECAQRLFSKITSTVIRKNCFERGLIMGKISYEAKVNCKTLGGFFTEATEKVETEE